MPFVDPTLTSRNQARYRTLDESEDFILQEHRYSLRKSRHIFWVRILTRTKPRFKVAQARSEGDIRSREWKYVTEDLLRELPLSLAALPVGSPERTRWLLDRIGSVRSELGDDNEDELDLAMDDLEELDSVEEEAKESEIDLSSYATVVGSAPATPTANSGSLSVSDVKSKLGLKSLVGKLRPRSGRFDLSEQGESPTSQSDLANLQKPHQDEGDGSRLRWRRGITLKRNNSSTNSMNDSGDSGDEMSNVELELDNQNEIDNENEWKVPLFFKSPSTAVREGLAYWSAGNQDASSELPSYLLSKADASTGRPYAQVSSKKRESITMVRLKEAHERRTTMKAIMITSTISIVMRFVSIDAFMLLLLALNVVVFYGVKNRHYLAKQFIRNSVKRRIRFTKQVWNSRFNKSSRQLTADQSDSPLLTAVPSQTSQSSIVAALSLTAGARKSVSSRGNTE